MDLSRLAKDLWPYLEKRIGNLVVSPIAGSSGGTVPNPHDLDSIYHSGALASGQAPQFLLCDGSRALTGNLTVSNGVTIDGVDVSGLADAYNAHAGSTAYSKHTGGLGSHTHKSAGAEGGTLDHGAAMTAASLLHDDHTIYALTPGTLSAATANLRSSGGAHYHAVTASSNPGAAASLLKTDADGYLQLVRLGVGTAPSVPLHALAASEQLRLAYDVSNYAAFTVGSGGNLTIAPTGDVEFNPTGNDMYPTRPYAINNGNLQKKWLTLHAAELWVETLVAQNTIATIGGRILVGPTTLLEVDLASDDSMLNGGFETAGGGGADVFADWTEYADDGSILRNNTVVHGGTYSCKLFAGVNKGTNLYQAQSVTAGKTYHLEFWQYGSGYYGCRYGVYDVAHSSWITSLTACPAAASWGRVQNAFTVPAGCTTVRIYFYCPAWVGEAGYIDDVSLTPATMYVKHNEMAVNDILYMEANGHVEFFQVVSGPTGAGPYAYGVQRNLDGSGVTAWSAGDAVFNTGAAGQGFIDLYSVHGVRADTEYGPTIVGNVRNTLTYNDWSEHWAVGNLNGIYGYGVDTYGFAAGKYSTTTSWIAADATNGFRIMRGSTQLARWDIDGNILIGQAAASQDNIYLSAGALSVRNNATERIGLTAAGILTIKDSGGNAVFTFNSSTGAEFTKPLTIATTGGIYQGTGTFASPTTGLKIWNDGGLGRIAGYNGGALQWYANTDGKLYAGAGNVLLDASGLAITVGTGFDPKNAVTFKTSGGATVGQLQSLNDPATFRSQVELVSTAQAGQECDLNLTATGGAADGNINLTATGNGETAYLYLRSEATPYIYFGGAGVRVATSMYVGGNATATQSYVRASGFYGTTVSITDDSVTSFTPGNAIGAILITPRASTYSDCWGMAVYRASATVFTVKALGSAIFDVTTGALAGTTGTDGHITVSAHTDGKIYIENRRGSSISIHYILLGA